MKFKYKTSEESSIAYYGWIIAIYGNFIIAISTLVGMHGTGFFLKAFETKYNWSRASISGASSFTRAQSGLFGPVEGYILDRFGARRVMTIGFVVTSLGFYFLSSTTTLFSLYISYMFMTLGVAISGWLPIITLMNSWFENKKTLAMALSSTGVHIAGAGTALLAFCIESYGIRNTALVISVIFLFYSPLSYVLIRDKQINSNNHKKKESKETYKSKFKLNINQDIKNALTHRPFWMIAIAHSFSTASVVTLGVHLPAHITDLGFSSVQAGYVIMIYSLVAAVAQIIGGYFGDKYTKKYVLSIFLVFQSLSLFILSFIKNIYGIIIFSICYGIGFGGRNPLLTSIRGDYFDRANFATLFGISGIVINIGTVLSPVLSGYLFDLKGDYTVAFIVLGILAIVGSVLSILLPKKTIK